MGNDARPARRRSASAILLGVAVVLLTGCAAAPTYAEVQATAQVTGCWPDVYPTPPAVTVTPALAATGTPAGTALRGTPTTAGAVSPSPLPTTTPYPRCPPRPGETQAPWPTPIPAPPPYPTMEPRRWVGGSDEQTTLHLPGSVYAVDLAVHPTEGWPVVGVIQRSWGTPIHAYVRVYHPQTQQWGIAQQVDIGESSIGMDRFGSLAVGVIGDRTVYAAWGASDRVLNDDGSWSTTPDLWVSSSTDYGASWAPPQRIATNCWNILDMATNDDGYVVVLAHCFTPAGSGYTPHATVIVRRPDGTWEPAQRLPIPASFGALNIAGDAADATAVGLLTAHSSAGDPRTLYLVTKRLADNGPWRIQTRRWEMPEADAQRTGNLAWHVRGLAFTRRLPNGDLQPGVLFCWHGRHTGHLYALTSLDRGQSWGPVEAVTAGSSGFIAPAYDPVADRVAAVWTAGDADAPSAATHSASWSVPGRGTWHDLHTPLIVGSREAGDTATAQALNSRMTWLAWVERGNQVVVRSLDLNTVIPVGEYPTPTSPLTPTPGGGL